METTTEEKPQTVVRKQISKIVPYIDGTNKNMGLSDYGFVLFEGAEHTEELTCLEKNGIKRWLTGLDEFAPEVQKIQDEEVRESRIRTIRERVSYLEKVLNSNVIDVDDKDFWTKVQTVSPNNHDFWKNVVLKVGNEPRFIDPADPSDLILLSGIEAGGFSIVAKSLDDARSRAVVPKFYLDRESETYATKTQLKKIKNEALALLTTLSSQDSKKMFYVVKNIDPRSDRYKLNTSPDIMYDFLDTYISGQAFERSQKKAAEQFVSVVKRPMEELKIRSVIADGLFHRFIISKPDGMLYHASSSVMLGRNVEDTYQHLKEPKNGKTWEGLLSEVEETWKI